MNKSIYIFAYLFLLLAGAALFFEIQLNGKRAELTDRNRMQEDYLVKIAKTIEKVEPDKNASFEIQKDASAVENKDIAPEMENILDEYPASLEQSNLETYNWENSRDLLRSIYVIDPMTGKPMMDGNQPQTRGSDEQKLLEQLFNSAKEQQTRLNNTRAQLAEMRKKLEEVVQELNKIKPEARKDKVTIDLRDEVQTAKNETEAAKEELTKEQKKTEQLKMLVKELIAEANARASKGGRSAVTSITNGDKGKIVHADNNFMYVIVEFSDEAIKELKGEDFSRPLPMLELSVRRNGYAGQAGELVGRIRLRQEVKGKNFIICDILGEWEQAKLEKGDIIVAD